ncbi:MAG: hypothetical protein KDI79_12410 [Anaerolineae bacterium]|nr:hypothetical protein [Anaerolineae bacterium]
MMNDKLAQAIAVYTVLEQKISEEDFKTLADIAKAQGGLGDLYQEVKSRAEAYRAARDNFTLDGKPDKAVAQEECLLQVERQMAIIEYLQFA